jgi:amidophosphoribosyltransferase
MGGFFGVASKSDCVAELFYGTDYHSHLGTRRGGLVVHGPGGFRRNIHDITNAPFRTKFEEDLPKYQGNLGLGVISDLEDQPLLIAAHHAQYAIVTVGRIDNQAKLTSEALKQRVAHFSEMKLGEVNPTELVATIINQEDDLVSGIRRVLRTVDGSCSLLLLTKDGIYAARDRLGRTPVTLGRRDGAWAVTLETCALPNLGFQIDRYLGPGEVVRITPEGVEQLVPPSSEMQVCSFLWIYYGYPASNYEGLNTEVARNRCGAALARRDDVSVDLVAGIPDSGIGHAIGYATESGVPYRRPFVKYTPTWPRSFMPQEQRVRDLVAKMKLIPVRDIIDGKRLLFCEDSIVRGTQLRDIITRLFDYGAREIHMRPACPPLLFGCKFLNFSRSSSVMDLAARKAILGIQGDAARDIQEYCNPDGDQYQAMVEFIRNHLGLTSLRYQRLDDMIEAISLPREKLCTYCWNGAEPYPMR